MTANSRAMPSAAITSRCARTMSPYGDRREIGTPWPQGRGRRFRGLRVRGLCGRPMRRTRAGRAHAAAQHVHAQHEIAIGVDRQTRVRPCAPTSRAPAGERMRSAATYWSPVRAWQTRIGIVARGIQRAVAAQRNTDRGQQDAAIERHAMRGSSTHRCAISTKGAVKSIGRFERGSQPARAGKMPNPRRGQNAHPGRGQNARHAARAKWQNAERSSPGSASAAQSSRRVRSMVAISLWYNGSI